VLKLYISDGRTGGGKRWEGGREGKKERWRFLIYSYSQQRLGSNNCRVNHTNQSFS
jgi:hypothetical protein